MVEQGCVAGFVPTTRSDQSWLIEKVSRCTEAFISGFSKLPHELMSTIACKSNELLKRG